MKRRVKSIGSTQHITRAMNLVAASKLQRASQKMNTVRPFHRETERAVYEITRGISELANPYFTPRQVKKRTFIVISGDRGLCGGYNVNVCKLAYETMNETLASVSLSDLNSMEDSVIAVGMKARDYFRKRRKSVIRSYSGISAMPFYEDAQEIASFATGLFNTRDADEVWLVYTEFLTTISHLPTAIKLLPLDPAQRHGERVNDSHNHTPLTIDFEPNEEEFLSYIVPKYVETIMYGALAESAACETASRMQSMDNATKNSAELIRKLTLKYNRVRQDTITQELIEIVSGASTL
jgi:F-type H+-transporting ATPase subunit gamma